MPTIPDLKRSYSLLYSVCCSSIMPLTKQRVAVQLESVGIPAIGLLGFGILDVFGWFFWFFQTAT